MCMIELVRMCTSYNEKSDGCLPEDFLREELRSLLAVCASCRAFFFYLSAFLLESRVGTDLGRAPSQISLE